MCAFAAVYLDVGDGAIQVLADYARRHTPTALGRPIVELLSVQRSIGGQMGTLLQPRWRKQPTTSPKRVRIWKPS